MSLADMKKLVAASGGNRNFLDGVLMSAARASMYGGEQLYFSGIDELNKNASAGLTEIHPTGKNSGYAKMAKREGAGRKPRSKKSVKVPIHTSGELNQLNPNIGNFKYKPTGYGGQMLPGLQGGSMEPGLQGGSMEPGLQGGSHLPGIQGEGQMIIGGFLGSIGAMLAPIAISATAKAIKKIVGKGAKMPTIVQRRALIKRAVGQLDPLIGGLVARKSLKLYPPVPGSKDPRFQLADPFGEEEIEGSGLFGSIARLVAPVVIPIAAKGVGELFKKMTGKGSGADKMNARELVGMGMLLKPITDDVASVMIPNTHGSGISPGLEGGCCSPRPGLTGGRSVRVSVGQQKYPGAQVKVGHGYQKMDPATKSARARAKAKSNPWMHHIAKVRSENPGLSYKDVLIKAKSSYR